MAKQQPVAFLSYADLDNEYDEGRIIEIGQRLSSEVQVQTGKKFHIFMDRDASYWRRNWKPYVERSSGEVAFLVPVVTPAYFDSQECRQEMEQFLRYERAMNRNDLILPIYYISSPILEDPDQRARDHVAKVIASRQYVDWRERRFEPLSSSRMSWVMAQLAEQISSALERKPPAAAAPPRARATTRGGRATSKKQAAKQKAARTLAEIKREKLELTRLERARPVRRMSAKTEPLTLVVDPGHGAYKTISEAIEVAVPGCRILVRPGTYREGLIVDKPLEIIGESERGKVIVEATGQDALLFKTTMGRVANLTFKQAGGGDWFGVDIAQGRLEMFGCEVTSPSMACVAIHGGADPRLWNNRIHGGVEVGIFIYEDGLGIIEDNDIYDNLGGVAITEGGNPTLRRNRIRDAREEGVFVYGKGQGLLEDNEIFGNGYSGVEIVEASNPTLRRNRIYGNKESGVFVHRRGLGTLENNEIFGNSTCEVTIKQGGNPTLRRNRIHGSKFSGVCIAEKGQGVIEDNKIYDNGIAGVEITGGSSPVVRLNCINRNRRFGVWAYDKADGIVEDNDLRDNKEGALEVSANSRSKVTAAHNTEE